MPCDVFCKLDSESFSVIKKALFFLVSLVQPYIPSYISHFLPKDIWTPTWHQNTSWCLTQYNIGLTGTLKLQLE